MERIINKSKHRQRRRELRKLSTNTERLLWSILRNRKTGYKWKRQVGIGYYIADFYCKEAQLVIELDGSGHLDTTEYDAARDDYFEQLGIATLRFWNYELVDTEGVYMKIIETCQSRHPHPNPLPKGEGASPS